MTEILLTVDDIRKTFRIGRNTVEAVRGISFDIRRGSTFGLVGESGSGKSTLARCALRLIPPTSGTSFIDGDDLGTMRGRSIRALRAKVGMVFQNPVAALNPRVSIASSIAEPLRTHTRSSNAELSRRVAELMDAVGLAREYGSRLPHQLSGGQCQRVGIARALATDPQLLILDEPTSALDVSVQAQILNLLQELKKERGLTFLMISHDLDVVRFVSDQVAVMSRGEIVEHGSSDLVLSAPSHEYTRTLLAATPGSRPRLDREHQ